MLLRGELLTAGDFSDVDEVGTGTSTTCSLLSLESERFTFSSATGDVGV